MTRVQQLRRSWRYESAKDRYLGFDGVEHYAVERDIGTGRWFAARSGVVLRMVVRRGLREHQRTRFFDNATGAQVACEREAERRHNEDKARRAKDES